MKAIETKRLTKFYGNVRGIENVDLSIDEGDLFGFIGPNGAGKSTTIRTLLGLISPTSGEARVLGRDIRTEMTDILADVGYLPAETNFYRAMKVSDVLKLSSNLHRKDCSDEAKRLCDRFELDVSRKVNELSLGNRKKVGIVCAMQHKPRLYILDEPTSGLDPLMQHEFFSLLSERNAEGATVFLSSHVLSEIKRYCRHAAVIREGHILACDRVDALGHTGAKRVTLRGVSKAPALGNMKDVTETADAVSFLYGGPIGELTASLASLSLTDLTVAEPDPEEVFMHYYTKEDEQNGDL